MSEKDRPVGVVCAMAEEVAALQAAMRVDGIEPLAGMAFLRGRLDGRPAVLVESGIGKVSAATVATLLLGNIGCRALVMAGVAGGIDPALGIGDVVVALRLIQHDYGALTGGRLKPYRPGAPPFGEPLDPLSWEVAPALADRLRQALGSLTLSPLSAAAAGGAPRVPRLHFGTLVTGDQFINCEAARQRLFAEFAAQATDMEGAAAAQVAERFGAPCVVVKSLSDLAGADSHIDFAAFLAETSAAAAVVVRRALPAI